MCARFFRWFAPPAVFAVVALVAAPPRSAAQESGTVAALAQAYARKALFLRTCGLPDVARVRGDLGSYIAAKDAGLVQPALQAFDQDLSPENGHATPSCASPDRTLGSLDRRIDGAKTRLQLELDQRKAASGPNGAPSAPASAARVGVDPQPFTASPAPPPPAVASQSNLQAQTAAASPENEFTNDPRIASLPESVRANTTIHVSQTKADCERNDSLVNAYDCGCYAGKLLAGIVAHGGPNTVNTPAGQMLETKTILEKLDMRPCLSDAKLAKYFSDSAKQLLRRMRQPADRADAIESCAVAKAIADVKEHPQLHSALSQYLSVALKGCTNP